MSDSSFELAIDDLDSSIGRWRCSPSPGELEVMASGSVPSSPPVLPQTVNGETYRVETGYARHERFYIEDGSVQFLVENVAYKLHRFLFLRDTPYFANLFATHHSNEPIELPGHVLSAEFDAFLTVLYTPCSREPNISSVEEWSAVLRLAREWQFDDIQHLAVKRLEPIATPIDKIVLGHEFGFSHWLRDAYVSLCTRGSPLSVAEIKAIRAEDVALIIEVRERTLVQRKSVGTMEDDISAEALIDSLSKPPPSEDSCLRTLSQVETLIDNVTQENLATSTSKILALVASVEGSKAAPTLTTVAATVLARAIDSEPTRSALYAHLSRTLADGISTAVSVGVPSVPTTGGLVFRRQFKELVENEAERCAAAAAAETRGTTAGQARLRRGAFYIRRGFSRQQVIASDVDGEV